MDRRAGDLSIGSADLFAVGTAQRQTEEVEHDCATAILRTADRVLMCHRSPSRAWIPGVWDFPGGHIEPMESPAQTLVRELSEELGVDIEPPDREPDAVLEFAAESVRLKVWILDYGGFVENRCPDEHDELRWVTRQEAEELELADASYIGLIAQALGR